MFGETFQCAEGFLHIGSGRPKVGVGEECAGAATYPLRTGLKVERGRGGLSGAGWVRIFLDSISSKQNLGKKS